MIEIKNISKNFEDIQAVDKVTVKIEEKAIFGMVGTNGAGKSTLLRMMSGVLKPSEGEVLIDGENVFTNPKIRENLFFIPDEAYFFASATPKNMATFYANIYQTFDNLRFEILLNRFGLSIGRKINTFSKGMKKQLSIILGICATTKYIFCDETFDGLDPVMRQSVKSLFAGEMESRGLTPIIASHNLRELEDICDHVGLLHKGGILLSKDLEEMKTNMVKVQCVFEENTDINKIKDALCIINTETRGKLTALTIRATAKEVEAVFNSIRVLFYEIIPLSLEEIFISETEVVGYDIKNIILG